MHDHHGHHSHHAPSFSGKINLSFGLAVFANLSFTIVEAALALEADSMGLLADAGHNLSDVWVLFWPGSPATLQPRKRALVSVTVIVEPQF